MHIIFFLFFFHILITIDVMDDALSSDTYQQPLTVYLKTGADLRELIETEGANQVKYLLTEYVNVCPDYTGFSKIPPSCHFIHKHRLVLSFSNVRNDAKYSDFILHNS